MRGTTVVELAFILPFFLLLILGGLHYGWLFYHLHRVTNATRHAARVGTLVGRSEQDVRDTITAVLGLGSDRWPNYNPGTIEVNIEWDVPIDVDGGTIPGIRVGIRLPTASNPSVLLIKSGRIPFGPSLSPEYLTASVTMAKEGG
jgi:hypothetical protein